MMSFLQFEWKALEVFWKLRDKIDKKRRRKSVVRLRPPNDPFEIYIYILNKESFRISAFKPKIEIEFDDVLQLI
jgi:hypothetical protein